MGNVCCAGLHSFQFFFNIAKLHSLGDKIRISNTNVKSVLLYACENWKTNNRIKKKQIFIKCLRRKMNRKWTNQFTNDELWSVTKQKPIEIQIKRRKLY